MLLTHYGVQLFVPTLKAIRYNINTHLTCDSPLLIRDRRSTAASLRYRNHAKIKVLMYDFRAGVKPIWYRVNTA